MQISERLKAIAECVHRGTVVADVGCDHGLTSIYLLKNNIADYVIASDINEAPLKQAAENIKRYGLTEGQDITLAVSDGIKHLAGSDGVQVILASGMGGRLIIDILKELKNKPDVENNIGQLVLSPQSDIHKVRKYLVNSGYNIYDEKMLTDGGKYYTVICAQPGCPHGYREYEYRYGKVLIEKKDSVLYEYLRSELDKKKKIIADIRSQADSNVRLSETVGSLKKDISDIEIILGMYDI